MANDINSIPTLTLDPGGTDTSVIQPPEVIAQTALKEVETAAPLEEEKLSEAEQKLVAEFSKQIDLTNSAQILKYGSAAQEKVASFADTALENVKTKELGEVGEMILDLVGELKEFRPEEERKGLARIFGKKTSKLEVLKGRYDKAADSVEKMCVMLEEHQRVLLKDIALLDKLYEVNLTNFKELSLYIVAGKRKLKEAREKDLAAFTEKARQSGLPEDAQAASDFAAVCDRFEKKIHDLELTRMIAIQSAPQIRLVQNSNTVLTEKIQTTIVNTVPLWKSQMLITLGLAHSADALAAQRQVTDMTNELLKKNADALKMATVETAREAERGIVDIETLTYTNSALISTLDEVVKITDEGKQKRRDAEAELARIETELKNKLLELR